MTDSRLIEALNARLGEELQAQAEYRAHAELARFWGYAKFAERLEGVLKEEYEHASELLNRIYLLGGRPELVQAPAQAGGDLPEALSLDHELEVKAVAAYTLTVRLAEELGEVGTGNLLRHILSEEEKHLVVLAGELTELEQMGEENWLAAQV